MKIIALVATGLTLLSAGAFAQDAQTDTKLVKVTNGSVVTLYSIPKNELTEKEKFATISGEKLVVKDSSHEIQAENNVVIQLGKSLKVYTGKAILTTGEKSFIVLQSDGRIESSEGDHKVTQFAATGTRIELPKAE